MIYITGDIHRDIQRIKNICEKYNTTRNDVLIILGDACINFYGDERDDFLKENISALPITVFCIHGNHEIRPQNIPSYIKLQYRCGTALGELEYPNLLFGIDGEIYNFDGHRCLVIGGAYSPDKFQRIERGHHWWEDEQPDDKIKEIVNKKIDEYGRIIDIILTHTCPLKYTPTEVFLPWIDQSKVDKSTEIWFDEIEGKVPYKTWFCGHWHTDKVIDRMRFMFNDVITL